MSTPRFIRFAVALSVIVPAALSAQARPISATEIDGYLRFLSGDLLEGRAPATRGDKLTVEYLASQLRSFGVEPAANGSYIQKVPIDILDANPATMRIAASGKATARFRYPEAL